VKIDILNIHTAHTTPCPKVTMNSTKYSADVTLQNALLTVLPATTTMTIPCVCELSCDLLCPVRCAVVYCVRLQVESYIHTLYSENPALCDVPPNAPVQGYCYTSISLCCLRLLHLTATMCCRNLDCSLTHICSLPCVPFLQMWTNCYEFAALNRVAARFGNTAQASSCMNHLVMVN